MTDYCWGTGYSDLQAIKWTFFIYLQELKRHSNSRSMSNSVLMSMTVQKKKKRKIVFLTHSFEIYFSRDKQNSANILHEVYILYIFRGKNTNK